MLPTGRNLFAVDPRSVPTRAAHAQGIRLAEELLRRHLQDHGDWPRRILLDLWGSANMRTGGDDLAQAMALLGVRPRWDHGSSRVNGFDILPMASLGRPRVDVTLRISGLFRDVFPTQIALFAAAIRAISELDEPAEDNPLAGQGDIRRIFGAAPGRGMIAPFDQLPSGVLQLFDGRDVARIAPGKADQRAAEAGGASIELAFQPGAEGAVIDSRGLQFAEFFEGRIHERFDGPLAKDLGAE